MIKQCIVLSSFLKANEDLRMTWPCYDIGLNFDHLNATVIGPSPCLGFKLYDFCAMKPGVSDLTAARSETFS